MISFNRVAIDGLQERIHGTQQQNLTWGSFEEVLREAHYYQRPKGRVGEEFEQWVEESIANGRISMQEYDLCAYTETMTNVNVETITR